MNSRRSSGSRARRSRTSARGWTTGSVVSVSPELRRHRDTPDGARPEEQRFAAGAHDAAHGPAVAGPSDSESEPLRLRARADTFPSAVSHKLRFRTQLGLLPEARPKRHPYGRGRSAAAPARNTEAIGKLRPVPPGRRPGADGGAFRPYELAARWIRGAATGLIGRRGGDATSCSSANDGD